MAIDYANVIQAALRSSEDESYPEEIRAMYRAKAEELMRKYRVAEEEALATDPTGSTPISRTVRLSTGGEMAHWYNSVFASIAIHTGCRYALRYVNHVSDDTEAVIVGYEGDVRYAEFLWTAALLTFVTKIDPSWDANLTPQENIYRLRNAGIERRVIADRAWGNGTVASARSKVQRIYLRECANRGETPRAVGLSHQTDTYRQAYARSFRDTLARRLRDARDAVDATGGALVMHGREERVDEAFYGLFPSYRPSTGPAPQPTPCDACAKAASGTCRPHTFRITKADRLRWDRATNSPSARAGSANGREAAADVLITRDHTRADRVTCDGFTNELEG